MYTSSWGTPPEGPLASEGGGGQPWGHAVDLVVGEIETLVFFAAKGREDLTVYNETRSIVVFFRPDGQGNPQRLSGEEK